MHSLYAYIAFMKRSDTDQYTIRGVPKAVGVKLHEKARREGKSLNKVAIETLMRGLDLTPEKILYEDLDDVVGTWIEDPEFDAAIRGMDRVDEAIWK
jgi:hypothetical protein